LTPWAHGGHTNLDDLTLICAVHARDHGTCQYPGCTHTHWLHIHHLTPWAHGGHTNLDDLTLICSTHHRHLHHHHITLHRTSTGKITATLPDGRTLTPTPPINPGHQPTTTLTTTTEHVTPDAIHTRDGGPFHLDQSLHVLLQEPGRAQAPRAA
ncbi:hypothetical protein UG55_103898, partial [Frankia sp. EI5c]